MDCRFFYAYFWDRKYYQNLLPWRVMFHHDSLVSPCVLCNLLPVACLPFGPFCPMTFTCVQLSVLSLIVLTCTPLPSCVNRPCCCGCFPCFIYAQCRSHHVGLSSVSIVSVRVRVEPLTFYPWWHFLLHFVIEMNSFMLTHSVVCLNLGPGTYTPPWPILDFSVREQS